MKKAKIFSLIITTITLLLSNGCNNTKYFDDSVKEALKVAKIDGNDSLTLSENVDTILLENEKVRLVLAKQSGAIIELANKEVGVYLVKNSVNDIPLMIEYVDGRAAYGYTTSNYKIKEKTENNVSIEYEWTYSRNLKIISNISLEKDSNEIDFSLKLLNNLQSDSVLCVEYPYISNVGQLYSAETDKLFHTYANGFIFDDPIKNFNTMDFNGIKWYMGLYPYGFGSTMQFMSYYVEDYGGFHLQTYDKGYGIKSFIATGTGNDLHFGIRHYLNDISDGDKEFYNIGISNTLNGTWTESCNKYYDFAKTCPWSNKKGKLVEQETYLKDFYEDTTLVNFAPHLGKAAPAWSDWEQTYTDMKNSLNGGKIFNIVGNDWQRMSTPATMNGEMDTFFPAVVNETYYNQMKENDYTAFFEFNNMFNTNATTDTTYSFRRSQATKDRYGNPQALIDSVDTSISWWYMCPSESWYTFGKEKSDVFVDTYNVDFLYHDCGYCVAPRSCFDTTHAHGTRVNIIEDEIAFLDKLTAETGKIVGEELISEVFIGTVGYYQARANAGGMSFMDINDIRFVVENNTAHKVSALDYVYHEYGIIRTDGYMKPLKESGNMYYYIMAFTALNGGIPQFNYEYIKASFNANEMVAEMLDYLNKLSTIKLNQGKNYLVYGKMLPAPNTGAGTIQYSYLNTSAIGDTVFSGKAIVDKVVTSAYSYDNKVGIFLSNITQEKTSVAFVINANRDYGINDGNVYLNGKKIAKVKNGKAKIKLDLDSRAIYMLEVY